jgi:RHS repeat-associated protein
MPGRHFSSENYQFGFNGKEKDDEVKESGNQQEYGLRIYDPRLGKFLSVDPLFFEFPWNSNYAFAENDVIRNVDLDGAEKHPYQYLPQWAQTTKDIFDGIGQGLEILAHDLAPIRPADENDPKTAAEAWENFKDIPSNLVNLPTSLKDVYTNGTVEEKTAANVSIVGSLYAASKGKSPTAKIGVVEAGFDFSKISASLSFLKKAENLKDIPFNCENVAMQVQKAVGGQFLQVTAKSGNQVGTIGGEATGWAHHVGVLKEGRVFDKLTGSSGMALDEYKKMFDFHNDLNFTAVDKIGIK